MGLPLEHSVWSLSRSVPPRSMLSLLIRIDFVLATLLLVAAPLMLLAASVRRPIVRERLLAYWRASSLLMVTVYLMMDGRPAAFVAGNAALVLIPLALRYGDALFVAKEAPLESHVVADWFRRWRSVATIFCVASLPLTLPTLRCVAGTGRALCQDWLAPPRELHAALHPSLAPDALGDAATVGLLLYGAYLIASGIRGARAVVRD
ncbi:MAG: DUF3177 family protein [Salinibacter sp.]